MRISNKKIEAVARALCIHNGCDPDSEDGGCYTVPYDAKWIGESNARYDGKYSNGSPWVYLWRRFAVKALVAIRAYEKVKKE